MDGIDVGHNEITDDAWDKSCYLLFMKATTTATNATTESFCGVFEGDSKKVLMDCMHG